MGDVNGAPRSGGSLFGMQPQGMQRGGGYQSPGMTKGGGSPMMGGPGYMNAASQFMTQLGPQLSQMQSQGGNPFAPQIRDAFTAMRAQGGSPDINQFTPTGPDGKPPDLAAQYYAQRPPAAAQPGPGVANFIQHYNQLPAPGAPPPQSGVANFQQHYNQLPAPPPQNVNPLAGRLGVRG